MFYVGIDWEDKGYISRILDESGESVVQSFYLERKQEDFETFSRILNKLSEDKSKICIGIETKHNPIVNYFLTNGYNVYVVNPNMMESLRMRYSQSKRKTDDFDAFVISDSLRTDLRNHELVQDQDAELKQMDLVFRQYSSVNREICRNMEHLTSLLKDYYPAFLTLFDDTFCKTALNLLIEYPDFESLSSITKGELKKFLWSNRCFKKKVVENIFKIAQSGNKFDSDPDVIKIRKSIAQKLSLKLKSLYQELKDYERILEELAKDDEDIKIFRSLPGSGLLTSVGLLLIFGRDRNNYNSAQEVNSIAGVVPVTIQSGNYKYDKFRSSCNKMYRNILRQFAFSSLTESKWAMIYFRRKKIQGKKNEHALRCLARLWIKVAFSLWKNRKTYDENIHLASMTRFGFKNQASGKLVETKN